MQPLLVGLVVYVIVFGVGSALLAVRRRRSPAPWLLFGAILGPIAIGLLLMAPPGRCPTCGAGIQGWLDVCLACGRPLHAAPTRSGGGTVVQQGRPLTDWLYGMPTVEEPGANGTADLTALARKPSSLEVATLAHRSQTAADATIPRVPPADVPANLRVLASGVFVGGSAGLEVGRRYEIGRRDGSLTVLGPVDSEPGKIQVERALQWITATTVGGRLVISDESGGSRSFSLVFERIAGLNGDALEASLQPDETVRRLA